MKVAVASGKGGTGKTMVAVNLAWVHEGAVNLVDCDVEEPNAHLFLEQRAFHSEPVTISVPQVEQSLCRGCGECSRFCEFQAIACAGFFPVIFPEMCHGCGGCILVCPGDALTAMDYRIGFVETCQAGRITLTQGRLEIGAHMAPPVIRAVKDRIVDTGLTILDAPPGTGCSVTATLRDVDFVILVTEATPFGLHDLKLAVGMVRDLGLSYGVVVNRMGVGDSRVHAFCTREGIPLLLEIPEDRRIAEITSQAQVLCERLPEYRGYFTALLTKVYLMLKGQQCEGNCNHQR